jgi:hypothetical protein
MIDIIEMMQNTPKEDYMHIIVCEDGELIPMMFVDPNEDDIAWAKRQLSDRT